MLGRVRLSDSTTSASSKTASGSTDTAPPPPTPPGRQTARQIFRERKWPLLGAGIFATAFGLYTSLVLPSLFSPAGGADSCICGHISPDEAPTGRPPALAGDAAADFDRSLNLPEWLSGIRSMRRLLARAAHGHVLEAAVGTGRNLGFYDWSGLDKGEFPSTMRAAASTSSPVLSYTGVDISIDMLNVALQKLAREVLPGRETCPPVVTPGTSDRSSRAEVAYMSGKVRLVTQDAQLPLPPRADTADGYYDTTIQTFGLCSVSDPAALLANLARTVKPDTGRIVLLEHGRGTWDWVNRLLDQQAPAHFRKFGCWWNRDIEDIVWCAARQVPGLEVVRLERPYILQMGTLIYVELRVNGKTSR